MKNVILLLGLASFLFSCDGPVTYSRTIEVTGPASADILFEIDYCPMQVYEDAALPWTKQDGFYDEIPDTDYYIRVTSNSASNDTITITETYEPGGKTYIRASCSGPYCVAEFK